MPKAGLFAGEVTPKAPADGATTNKQKGYHWMEWGRAVQPTSGQFAPNIGYAATDNRYWQTTTLFPHPLAGNSYSEWSVSAVFQCTTAPTFQDPYQGLFNVNGASVFGVLYWPGGGYAIRCHMRTFLPGFSNTQVCSSDVRLNDGTSGTLGWSVSHWYCATGSYSQSLNRMEFSIVNMSLGEEVVAYGTILNNFNIGFLANGYSQEAACCRWGAQSSNTTDLGSPWLGSIANVYINDKFVDLTDESVRRNFSGIDGIVYVGDNGEIPFGEVPMCYMPSGGPWDNRGTVFWGEHPVDFYLSNPIELDENLPPIAS